GLAVALVLTPDTPYPYFILPFLLIGAGFVIATTVRTAIIFASIPKGLPASAAALNEASIGMGSRVGIVVAAVLTTQTALESYRRTLFELPTGLADSLLAHLRWILEEVSLHTVAELTGGLDPGVMHAYADAAV